MQSDYTSLNVTIWLKLPGWSGLSDNNTECWAIIKLYYPDAQQELSCVSRFQINYGNNQRHQEAALVSVVLNISLILTTISKSSCRFLQLLLNCSEVAYSKYQSLFFILLLNFWGFFSRSAWNLLQIAAS